MTNYEHIISQMTPENFANYSLKLVMVNDRPFYMTSSGQLYYTTEYEKALRHEYNILTTVIPGTEENEEKAETQTDIASEKIPEEVSKVETQTNTTDEKTEKISSEEVSTDKTFIDNKK